MVEKEWNFQGCTFMLDKFGLPSLVGKKRNLILSYKKKKKKKKKKRLNIGH